MFDLYSIESSKIHVEMINRMASESMMLCRSLAPAQRLSLRQRLLGGMGNLLIDVGIRLKAQALNQPETASSPTWMITL